MSIRYSPARSALPGMTGRAAQRRIQAQANNDNCDGTNHDALLHEALRCFARNGLSTVDVAAREAQAAHAAGDEAGARRWLAVVRTFDRRRATGLAARFARFAHTR